MKALKQERVSERSAHPIPEKWRDISLDNITDAQAHDLVNEVAAMGVKLRVQIPLLPETATAFLRRLRCDHCGACCRGDFETTRKGGVALLPNEVAHLAQMMRQTQKSFRKKFCHRSCQDDVKVVSLRYPCPFWSAQSHCTIYDRRPLICRFYPLQEGPVLADTGSLLDGVELIHADSSCPAARELVVEIIMAQAKIVQSDILTNIPPEVQKEYATAWNRVKEWQTSHKTGLRTYLGQKA